jgi:hypothetical protein
MTKCRQSKTKNIYFCPWLYISGEFQDFLNTHGIERQQTPPHTPEHNGVSERANRTLMEMARSMIYASRVSLGYWGAAINTAAYIRNRVPTRTLNGITPFEAWTGAKPSLDHLRVFGCKAYVHVPDATRSKLEPKAIECVFIGYSSQSKGWLLYQTAKRRVIVSRDVIFDESAACTNSSSIFEPEYLQLLAPTSVTASTGAESNATSEAQREPESLRLSTQQLTNPASRADMEMTDDIVELDVNISDREPTPLRRSARERWPTVPFHDQELNRQLAVASVDPLLTEEPNTYKQAMSRPDCDQWKLATRAEMDAIKKSGTWILTELPVGKELIGCKWVFRLKRKADGSIDKYKARLVAQGFKQREGVDFTETFAPVAKFSSIRALLALAAHYDLEVDQMDVVSAYLNGDIDADIYMKQPEGFVTVGQEHLVCKLQKSLYGLKQAGRQWYHKIDESLINFGFTRLQSDHCLYVLNKARLVIWLALYVDDILLISNSKRMLNRFKLWLSQQFSMKDLGEAHFILGIQITRDRANRKLTISQQHYVESIVARYRMDESRPVSTPMECGIHFLQSDCPSTQAELDGMRNVPYQSAVGAIMYTMLATRPDVAYAITRLSQFNTNYGQKHWVALKRLLRYLHGTANYGITYGRVSGPQQHGLVGYCDSDWGFNEDRRSVSGYSFIITGGAVSWSAKTQPTVALSSVEAEYMSSTHATKEALWWRSLLTELGRGEKDLPTPTTIFSDSQGSIALVKNPEFHSRTKHISIQQHFVREHVERKAVTFVYKQTQDMAADVLTKALARQQHLKLIEMFGLGPVPRPSAAVVN